MMAKTSIAVLPFVNISADDENEYFCDGITEEIINALAKIEALKVISRTSSFFYKNHKASITEIGTVLNVSNILEGSVRVSGNQLRITAQLINVEDDTHFWSETWDRPRDNIFEIQDEISLHIAEKLREHFGHLDIADHLASTPTKNITAYEHYLRGKHLFYQWNPTETHKAIEHFHQAVSIDPGLIEAHLGLADGYSFLGVAGFAPREAAWNKANKAILTAQKIDATNAGLNYLLGNQAFFTEADFGKAVRYGLKSLSSNPTYPEAHRFMSFLYTLKGHMEKSKEHIGFAKSIDPLNPETRFFEANQLYRQGNYKASQHILDELLVQNPRNLPAVVVRNYIYLIEGEHEKARTMLENTPDEVVMPDEKAGLLCLNEVLQGIENPSQLAQLEAKIEDPQAHQAHSYLFIVYANLGRNDDAFSLLENLFSFHSSVLLLGFSDPLAAPIRSDKRYSEWHEKIYTIPVVPSKLTKASSTQLDDERSRTYRSKLITYVEEEKPYLNPGLSLRLLADQVEIHPNQLSWLLNESMGQNFNEFINTYRIAHFKALAANPSNDHISLIGLAYESGFNSKTVFNTTFKKMEGITPREFQKAATSGK